MLRSNTFTWPKTRRYVSQFASWPFLLDFLRLLIRAHAERIGGDLVVRNARVSTPHSETR
jgi:hypothetical protein